MAIVYDVIISYSSLFSSKKAVYAVLRAEESYKTAYDIAQEKYDLGLVPKADVLKADTQYAQSILDRQKTENSFLNYQGAFSQLLNIPQGQSFSLEEPNIIINSKDIDSNIENLIEQY